VGVASSLLVTLASSLGWLEGWQARGLDLLLRFRGPQFPNDVVVVAIDDTAFETLGRRQPLPREYLARVIRGLERAGAAVVGLDITLGTPTTPEADRALAAAMLALGEPGRSRVVVVGPLVAGSGPLGEPAFVAAVVQASPWVPQDDDGLIRRVAPVPPDGAPTLALAAAARLAGLDRAALDAALRARAPLALPHSQAGRPLGAAGPPVALDGGLWTINYVGPARSFLTIPSDAIAALAEPGAEVAADNPLRGRIVMLGGTFQESRDLYYTPHGLMAGVEVHANVAHMLTTRRFIQPSGWVVGLALHVAVVLGAGLVLLLLRPLAGTLVCVAGALVLGVPAAYLAFDRGGYWVDFLLPVLATCVMGFGTDALARRRFQDAFGRYLSREVMAEVLDDAPSLRGERREISVLFSDLRGFTTLSETMAPERVAAHLNEYFDGMTRAIFAHRGMINDFVGDAVMAVFGAPVADADHALHAVQSACAMDEALGALNRRWEAAGLPQLRMGIGIHSGQVFAGNVGGPDRIKYTVIGDPVNVAARVEGLNKDLGTTILITEATRLAVGERVTVKDRGMVPVKGRVQDVHVFEVLAVERAAPANGGG
jgi:adenylate cyclase